MISRLNSANTNPSFHKLLNVLYSCTNSKHMRVFRKYYDQYLLSIGVDYNLEIVLYKITKEHFESTGINRLLFETVFPIPCSIRNLSPLMEV